jgi:hypothetical protein
MSSRLSVQDKTSVDFDQQIDEYGKRCNLDLSLLVVIDQEPGN